MSCFIKNAADEADSHLQAPMLNHAIATNQQKMGTLLRHS